MGRFRTIVIGLGKQNVQENVPAMVRSGWFKICGVYDIDCELAIQASRDLGVKWYSSVIDMIRELRPEVALIAVPHSEYSSLITLMAQHSINVIKEKPYAISEKEISLYRQMDNIHILTCLKRRYHPLYKAFCQYSSHIGEPYYFEARYLKNLKSLNSWRAKKTEAGGGALIDMGYHFIDLIIDYFGRPYVAFPKFFFNKKYEHNYEVEETVHITLEYKEGLFGDVMISLFAPFEKEYISVFGSKGHIFIDKASCSISVEGGEEIVMPCKQDSIVVNMFDDFGRILSEPVNHNLKIEQELRTSFILELYKGIIGTEIREVQC